MAERKAVNKYYPPDWTPKMGSINKYRGSHPLRERARKLGQGILIIRFEMPYNIWCDGCGNHIGMGVRYNAEKKKVGMYYTTPIYQFRMKCHLCDNHFEMKTDPQNLDYIVVSGARRQERRWDPTQNGQVVPDDKDVSNQLSTDAMFKLEHVVDDQTKSSAVAPSLARLENLQSRWQDHYTTNKILRNQFREKKHELAKRAKEDKLLLIKSSLDITLLPEDPQDKKLAGLIKLAPLESIEDKQRHIRDEIQNRDIFESANRSKTGTLADSLKKLIKTSADFTPTKGLSSLNIGVIVKPMKADNVSQQKLAPSTSNTGTGFEINVNTSCTKSSLVSYGTDTSESDES